MRQIKIGTAALAAIAVLAACSDDSANDKAGDNEAAADSSSVGADPSESTAESDYKKLPENTGSDSAIEAGRWAVQAEGPDDAPLAVFDVPEGFNGSGPNIWTNKAVIGYWTLDGVYADPCADTDAPASAGDTVEDLAAAFAAQDITTTTEAAPVSIGGHDGLFLELSTPAGFDTATCHEDALLHIWPDSPSVGATDHYRYWILDVDGDRVLITLGAPPEATDESVQLFTGIVEGVTFDDAQ